MHLFLNLSRTLYVRLKKASNLWMIYKSINVSITSLYYILNDFLVLKNSKIVFFSRFIIFIDYVFLLFFNCSLLVINYTSVISYITKFIFKFSFFFPLFKNYRIFETVQFMFLLIAIKNDNKHVSAHFSSCTKYIKKYRWKKKLWVWNLLGFKINSRFIKFYFRIWKFCFKHASCFQIYFLKIFVMVLLNHLLDISHMCCLWAGNR